MRFYYISPSTLPSRAANAVHVVLQTDALARMGAEVTLFAKRSIPNPADLVTALADIYAVNATGWRLVSYHSQISLADNMRIAAHSIFDIQNGDQPDVVLSRNLYASYVLAVLKRRPLIFETHQLEFSLRKTMQGAIMTCPWVTTVVISQSLVHHLTEHHGKPPSRPLVLHDAAPSGIQPLARESRRAKLENLVPQAAGGWQAICAYFGHLYTGRGIEIIDAMAKARPAVLFLVFGGNEADVIQRCADNKRDNLLFMGYVPHAVAREVMCAADILLSPYQSSVSIGVGRHDTAQWMSPMKMFEYMASGVPIISSDLPVLREVLENERNALLVNPANPIDWLTALDRYINDPTLARQIGETGHSDYQSYYTWDQRARKLLAASEPF